MWAAYSSLYRGGPGSGGAVLVRCTNIPHDVGWGVVGHRQPGVCVEAVEESRLSVPDPFVETVEAAY